MIIALLKYTEPDDPHVKSIIKTLESDTINWNDCPPAFATIEQGDMGYSDSETNKEEYCVSVYAQLPDKPILPRTVVDIITAIETANPILGVTFVKFGDRLGKGFLTVSIELRESGWKYHDVEWDWSEDDIKTFVDTASPLYKPMDSLLNSPELDWSDTPKKYFLKTRPVTGFQYLEATLHLGGGKFVGRDFLANLLEGMCNSSPTLCPTTCGFYHTLLNEKGWQEVILSYSDDELQRKFSETAENKEFIDELRTKRATRIKEGREYTNVLCGTVWYPPNTF